MRSRAGAFEKSAIGNTFNCDKNNNNYNLNVINKDNSNNFNSFYQVCNNKRCEACKEIVTLSTAISNVTNREYAFVNNEQSLVNCYTSNFIYLLTCSKCNQQYIGESRQQLHLRLNGHRGP